MLTGITIALALALAGPAPSAPLELEADLNGDGEPDRVEVFLNESARRGFVMVHVGPHHVVSAVYPMWKVRTASLSRKPGAHLVVGVWSRKRRHREPQPHRTVWVLEWRNDQLVESWRGSALARPLQDFVTGDLDGDGLGELLALERTAKICHLTAYRFDGFGFKGLARLDLQCVGLSLTNPNGVPVVTVDGAHRRVTLTKNRIALEQPP